MSNNKRYFLEDNNAFKEICVKILMSVKRDLFSYLLIHGYTYNNTNVITALFDRARIQLKGGYEK